MSFILFILGLVIIIKGGDIFIDSAIIIARKLRVSELIIGATIVSLGTTLPEVAASVNASIQGQSQFALGNAIGSIDINTGFILGVLILLSNISINKSLFRKEGMFLLGFVVLLIVLSMDNLIGRVDGIFLLGLLVIYLYTSAKAFREHSGVSALPDNDVELDNISMTRTIFTLIMGAVLLVVGAQLLVDNGVKIATILGIPSYIISLTLVAFGTSLPELVTSIIALIKKHQSLSVGNIIGANVLNIGLATSLSAMVNPITVTDSMLAFDYVITLILVMSSVIFGLIYNGYRKYNGLVLVAIYVMYIFHLYVGFENMWAIIF
ncbi:MAG: calcium/sodium antiporter [Halanaerobiales bacterium]